MFWLIFYKLIKRHSNYYLQSITPFKYTFNIVILSLTWTLNIKEIVAYSANVVVNSAKLSDKAIPQINVKWGLPPRAFSWAALHFDNFYRLSLFIIHGHLHVSRSSRHIFIYCCLWIHKDSVQYSIGKMYFHRRTH